MHQQPQHSAAQSLSLRGVRRRFLLLRPPSCNAILPRSVSVPLEQATDAPNESFGIQSYYYRNLIVLSAKFSTSANTDVLRVADERKRRELTFFPRTVRVALLFHCLLCAFLSGTKRLYDSPKPCVITHAGCL